MAKIYDEFGDIRTYVYVKCKPCDRWFPSQAVAGGTTECKLCHGTVRVPKDARGSNAG